MQKLQGYDEAQAFTGDFESINPGAYICRIRHVIVEQKSYGELLKIGFDIADGEYKGFYQKKYAESQSDKWPGMLYQTSMNEKPQFFKGFITAIEKSNDGFKWNWNEQELVNRVFLGVFGEEEYKNSSGDIKTICKIQQVRSIEQLGKIKPPEIKRLKQEQRQETLSFTAAQVQGGMDLPF